jgi:hypothetical protein
MAISAKRVTVLGKNPDGTFSVTSESVVESGTKKKKGTKGLGLVEKIVRTGVDVSTTSGSAYLSRHKKSNQKKKDGWLKDAPVNVIRAGLKGVKQVKIGSFL